LQQNGQDAGQGAGQDLPARSPPLARTIFRGALFLGALRFAIRLLGFVSITITARLLTPADFGVVGTAAIVTGFFLVLQQNGIGDALTRLRSVVPDDVHTAWTLNLLVAGLVTTSVFLMAGPAAVWLDEPKIAGVLQYMAFGPLIHAMGSPGTATILRNLQFQREFRLRIIQKVGLVICVVLGALIFRDYWGLVYGTLAGAALGAVMSHVMVPYPVRLRLTGAAYFLTFSAWTMLQALAAYVGRKADEVAVRQIVDTATFGLYHVARDLSRVFVAESVAPAGAALLPGLARLQDDPERFARAAALAVGVGAIVAIAVGLGLSAVAPEAVVLLLGAQWAPAAQFLAIVSIGGAAGTLVGMHRAILVAMGRIDLSAKLSCIRAALLVGGCALASLHGSAVTLAMTYTAIWIVWFFLDGAIVFRLLGRPGAIVAAVARPLLAGLAMTLVLHAMPWPQGLPLIALTLLKVAVGAAVYVGVLGGIWWARGRPEGPESTLLEQVPRGLGRRLLPRRGVGRTAPKPQPAAE
jgi:O-antigen/teichoic acid export membrane protein